MGKSKRLKKQRKQEAKALVQKPTLGMILKSWWQEKNPVLGFLGKFLFLIVILHAIRYTPFYLDVIQPALASANGYISHLVLNLMGYETVSIGTSVHSEAFSMNIVHGCDATEAVMIFISIVLAFPVGIYKRLIGALSGTIFLLLVNLIRVISLFLIGVHYIEWFEFAHIEAWQFIFIMLALVTCAFWIRWAMPALKKSTDVE